MFPTICGSCQPHTTPQFCTDTCEPTNQFHNHPLLLFVCCGMVGNCGRTWCLPHSPPVGTGILFIALPIQSATIIQLMIVPPIAIVTTEIKIVCQRQKYDITNNYISNLKPISIEYIQKCYDIIHIICLMNWFLFLCVTKFNYLSTIKKIPWIIHTYQIKNICLRHIPSKPLVICYLRNNKSQIFYKTLKIYLINFKHSLWNDSNIHLFILFYFLVNLHVKIISKNFTLRFSRKKIIKHPEHYTVYVILATVWWNIAFDLYYITTHKEHPEK